MFQPLDKRDQARALDVALCPSIERKMREFRNPFHRRRLDHDPIDKIRQFGDKVAGVSNAESSCLQGLFQDLGRDPSADLEGPLEDPIIAANNTAEIKGRIELVGLGEIDGAGEPGDPFGVKGDLIDYSLPLELLFLLFVVEDWVILGLLGLGLEVAEKESGGASVLATGEARGVDLGVEFFWRRVYGLVIGIEGKEGGGEEGFAGGERREWEREGWEEGIKVRTFRVRAEGAMEKTGGLVVGMAKHRKG